MILKKLLMTENKLHKTIFIDLISVLPIDIIIIAIAIEETMDGDMNNGMMRLSKISKLYKLVKITRLFRLLKLVKNKGRLIK